MAAILEDFRIRTLRFPEGLDEARPRGRSFVVDRGASRSTDRAGVRRLLADALAAEAGSAARYRRHHIAARRLEEDIAARDFAAWAEEDQRHAVRLAARIRQLGGEPEIDPEAILTAPEGEGKAAGRTLSELIREDLVAERIAIEILEELIRFVGDEDHPTRRLLESILSDAEGHAEKLRALLLDRRRSHVPITQEVTR